jgi:ATP-binding protein involved in chromosome partitioning
MYLKHISAPSVASKGGTMSEALADRVKNRIMVISGKGGVGKTTVSVNLALGFAMCGKHIGLLDADITGPNVPKMLNLEGQMLMAQEDGTILPFYLPVGHDHGLEIVSMAFAVQKEMPIAWRGPMKMRALREFVENVSWGDLDYLLVDLPPGTGDEPISVAQLIRPNGAIVVTTPQDVALLDAKKAISLANAIKVPVLGIIENMSAFSCPKCGGAIDLFKVGGGKRMAEELDVPFLGKIELDPMICEAGDSGMPVILGAESSVSKSFEEIVAKLLEHYGDVWVPSSCRQLGF